MMYKKAVLFHDTEIASKILQTSDVAEIKRLGRAVSGYNENDWNGQNLLGYALMMTREKHFGSIKLWIIYAVLMKKESF